MAVIVLAQIASGLPYFPYYYTYPNPLLAATSANFTPGYGEGLDLAANYLAQKQDLVGLRAFVYNGMGTFSYFYPGPVEIIKRQYFLVDRMPDVIRGMHWSQYVVVYLAGMQDLPECAHFLDVMGGVKAERVFYVDGREYVRIYRTQDIPESVFAALAQ